MHYKNESSIEQKMKPPQKPPEIGKTVSSLIQGNYETLKSIGLTLPDGRYLHWDDLRRREPPSGLSDREWWAAMKFARENAKTVVEPMTKTYARTFAFT